MSVTINSRGAELPEDFQSHIWVQLTDSGCRVAISTAAADVLKENAEYAAAIVTMFREAVEKIQGVQ
jgi:hypothetical protein